MMHLIVFSYASAPLSDCAEEGKQTAAKAWVKANYKPPTKFILSALDSVVPDISAEFDDIRGKARSLSEQPKVYEIVLSVEERIRKEIFGYIEALKVKAAERILHIWQENLEGSVIEDESSYPSDLPTVVASGDEKPSPLGRPAPLRKIDGPPSPIRRDVRSSPTGYSPKQQPMLHLHFKGRKLLQETL